MMSAGSTRTAQRMSTDLIIALARHHYDIELSPSRASELAAELERLGAASGAAGQALAFDEACWSHAAVITASLAVDTFADE